MRVGRVIAGGVGQRKYQCNVWGDRVNLAARMEEAATIGSVCVNSGTWRRVERFCRGRLLGLIAVKGKGDLEIFCAEGVLGSHS